MPYNFAADSFHTKKLCSRLSSSEVRFYTEIGRFAFLSLSLGDVGATYDDHLWLIEKRIVDFLLVCVTSVWLSIQRISCITRFCAIKMHLIIIIIIIIVLIELFSLCVTVEALRANIGSKSAISLQQGPVDPNLQVEWVAHQPFFFSEN